MRTLTIRVLMWHQTKMADSTLFGHSQAWPPPHSWHWLPPGQTCFGDVYGSQQDFDPESHGVQEGEADGAGALFPGHTVTRAEFGGLLVLGLILLQFVFPP